MPNSKPIVCYTKCHIWEKRQEMRLLDFHFLACAGEKRQGKVLIIRTWAVGGRVTPRGVASDSNIWIVLTFMCSFWPFSHPYPIFYYRNVTVMISGTTAARGLKFWLLVALGTPIAPWGRGTDPVHPDPGNPVFPEFFFRFFRFYGPLGTSGSPPGWTGIT